MGSLDYSNFRLDHVGIAVRSLSASTRFFEQALGLKASASEQVEAEAVAIAAVGSRDGAWLELLEPLSDDSAIGKFIARHGPGLHHLALRVANLEDAMERMKSAGGRLLGEPKVGAGGRRVVFVHPESTGRILIELVEVVES